jgi:CheY-like chemotaxis protein
MVRSTFSHLRALVADDQHESVHRIGQLLERFGCDLTSCNDGSACLVLATRIQPQLILLDIALPGLDAFAVAEKLRHSHLPPFLLVALTHEGETIGQEEPEVRGFDRHLPTTAGVDAFRDLIQAASQRAGLPMPNETHFVLKCTPGTKGTNAAIEVDGVAHEAWSVQEAAPEDVRDLCARADKQFGGIEISPSCSDCFPQS